MLDSRIHEGAAEAAEKKAAQAPRRDDFVREFGAEVVTDLPNGEWEVNLSGIENVRRYTEMMEGVRRIDIERGEVVNSRIVSEVALDASGREVHVPAHDMDDAARRRGLHAKVYYGKPSERIVYHADGSRTIYTDSSRRR